MILKNPPTKTGDLKIEDDLLVEKVHLEDSLIVNNYLQLATFLPFKAAAVQLDSVEKTKALLKKRTSTP